MKCAVYPILGLFAVVAGCVETSVSPIKTCDLATISPYANLDQVTFLYDSNNRVDRLKANGSVIATLIYDTLGNMVSIGSSTYTYNNNNQLIQIVMADDGAAQRTTTWSYSYTTSGQVASETTELTSLDSPTSIFTLSYQYPNASTNNFNLIDTDNGVVHVEYDDKPNPLKRLGVVGRFFDVNYGFPPLYFSDNNITKIRVVSASGEVISTFTYMYNQYRYPLSVTRFGAIVRTYSYNCP